MLHDLLHGLTIGKLHANSASDHSLQANRDAPPPVTIGGTREFEAAAANSCVGYATAAAQQQPAAAAAPAAAATAQQRASVRTTMPWPDESVEAYCTLMCCVKKHKYIKKKCIIA